VKFLHLLPIKLFVGSKSSFSLRRPLLTAIDRSPLVTVVFWGGIMMCNAAPKDFSGLMAARFFLGIMEGSVAPAFVILISHWYK